GQLDQVLQRTAQPVQLGDHQLVAVPYDEQRLIELRTARELARGPVDEHLLAASRAQRVVLSFGMLVTSRDPGVADAHTRTVSRTRECGTHVRTRLPLQPRPARTDLHRECLANAPFPTRPLNCSSQRRNTCRSCPTDGAPE